MNVGAFADIKEKYPWWPIPILAIVLLVGAAWLLRSVVRQPDLMSSESMAENVDVYFSDTDTTMAVPRGRIIGELSLLNAAADQNTRLKNPANGKLSGVVKDEAEWKRLIVIVNATRIAPTATPEK